MDNRPSWHDYFFGVADLISTRGTCNRLVVGIVLVKDNRIVATGYNGSAPGDVHCIQVGCLIENGHCIRTIHAEENAIFNAARFGVSLQSAEAFVTHEPCIRCRRALYAAGIQSIHHRRDYSSKDNTHGIN